MAKLRWNKVLLRPLVQKWMSVWRCNHQNGSEAEVVHLFILYVLDLVLRRYHIYSTYWNQMKYECKTHDWCCTRRRQVLTSSGFQIPDDQRWNSDNRQTTDIPNFEFKDRVIHRPLVENSQKSIWCWNYSYSPRCYLDLRMLMLDLYLESRLLCVVEQSFSMPIGDASISRRRLLVSRDNCWGRPAR